MFFFGSWVFSPSVFLDKSSIIFFAMRPLAALVYLFSQELFRLAIYALEYSLKGLAKATLALAQRDEHTSRSDGLSRAL